MTNGVQQTLEDLFHNAVIENQTEIFETDREASIAELKTELEQILVNVFNIWYDERVGSIKSMQGVSITRFTG